MRLEPPKKSLRLAAVILSHRVWLTGLCQKRHFSFTLFRMFTISRATQLRCMPWPDAWRRCLISPLKSASALPSVSMDGPRIPMLSGNRSIVCMPHMPQGNIWPMIRFSRRLNPRRCFTLIMKRFVPRHRIRLSAWQRFCLVFGFMTGWGKSL